MSEQILSCADMCLSTFQSLFHAYAPKVFIVMHSLLDNHPLYRTVEINNTDAEGRLVLGDGVSPVASNILVHFTVHSGYVLCPYQR